MPGNRSEAAPSQERSGQQGPSAGGRTVAVTPAPGQADGTGCRPAQLRLTLGPKVSEATQQDTSVLVLTNVSAAGCELQGYPAVTLSGRDGARLAFRYRRGGDQILTGAAPALVPLRPGAAAYFAISKVTCVAPAGHVARRIQVIPPGGHQALSHTVRRFPALGYCKAGTRATPSTSPPSSPACATSRTVTDLRDDWP